MPACRRVSSLLAISALWALCCGAPLAAQAGGRARPGRAESTRAVSTRAETQDGSGRWLALAGTLLAALIAGGFGVYGLRRSTAAQRALEREKIEKARTETELAQARASTRDYRRAQALPFLEALDRTLNESYKAAYVPPYFPDLCGYVPQLQRYADRALSEWLEAMERMSQNRIRLLLVLDAARVESAATLMTELMAQAREVMERRRLMWFSQSSQQDVWEAQRAYVSVGYRLMSEVWSAVSALPRQDGDVPAAATSALAEKLSLAFEKGSAVSIPYGALADFCWIAIWHLQTDPEVHAYVESRSGTSSEEFEEKLKELASALYHQAGNLDMSLVKVRTPDMEVPCLAVSFPSRERLEQFLETELPLHREGNKALWSPLRAPVEIEIGRKKGTKKHERPVRGEPAAPPSASSPSVAVHS